MKRQETLAMELLQSLKKEKGFLTMALVASLVANAVLVVVAFIKK